jgi:membrane protein
MIKKWLGNTKILFKDAFRGWVSDSAPKLSAALAYYTVFSMAPLLIICIALASFAFDKEAAQGQIVAQISGLVGKQGAEAIQEIILRSNEQKAGLVATILGIATLLFGATGVFVELQDSLNHIWRVVPQQKSGGLKAFFKNRLLSFALILGVGFLLIVSLVVSAVLTAVTERFGDALPGADFIWPALNFLVSFGVITVLFAMMYRILPALKIAWNDVWVGAAITALLFTIGKSLIGLYLGSTGVSSSYGAAGSFVLVLVWIYYTSQVFFLGAEFTRAYATRFGSRNAMMSQSGAAARL